MGRRFYISILCLLLFNTLCAQKVQLFKQHNMKRWGVPAGHYSGITQSDRGTFCIVSDKQEAEGWTNISIDFLHSGDIDKIRFDGFHYESGPTQGKTRDSEAIVFTNDGNVFIAAENDQQIQEVTHKRRALAVPSCFNKENIFPNYGFESLAYNANQGIFWTTTEQGLRSDVSAPSSYENPTPTLLRIQSFGPDLQPLKQYAYKTDSPEVKHKPRHYAFGVSEMVVIDDTTLLVMERELYIPKNYNRAKCNIRLYSVNIQRQQPLTDTTKPLSELDASAFLPKTLVASFSTGFRIFGKKNFANYEGMCLGPKLSDGSQIIVLIADSQGQAGNSLFHLKEFVKTVRIEFGNLRR